MKKVLPILLLVPFFLFGQRKATRGVQIVVAVNTKKQEITTLYSLPTIKKSKEELKNCAECSYFLGELEGDYKQHGIELSPMAGATITVFKDQEVFAKKVTFPLERFKSTNEINLAKTKATVVENKKGELILKTTNNEN